MFKTKRGWLLVAAALAVGASAVARADDNGMNPMHGGSYAMLEGQGHNAGTPGLAPEGASAARSAGTSPATTNLTGSTSPPSAAGPVVESKPANVGEPLVTMPSQTANNEGVRIAPVNPRGQGPTVVGPSGV